MRNYEVMFILKPDLPEEESDRIVAQMESVVTSTGGSLGKVEKMGRRRLAYALGKYHDGYYVLFVLESEAATLQELERRLKVADAVLRYLTVRVDEEKKRLEKLQGARAKRASKHKTRPKAEPEASPA